MVGRVKLMLVVGGSGSVVVVVVLLLIVVVMVVVVVVVLEKREEEEEGEACTRAIVRGKREDRAMYTWDAWCWRTPAPHRYPPMPLSSQRI
ncbi:hypothetical protein M0804_006461 [Polistes exclamans]|nr:hypothetical protein M0804_006461 [Polistes exclamans]